MSRRSWPALGWSSCSFRIDHTGMLAPSVVSRKFDFTPLSIFRSALVGEAGGRGGSFSGHARGRLPERACVVASTPLRQRLLWGNREWPCARPTPTTGL
jgi:hypothetical protein